MDLSKIQAQLDLAKSEIEQLKLGRKVSSSRARAALMKIKKESDIIRKEILTHSKNLPVKQRKTTPKTEVIPEKPIESPTDPTPTVSVSDPTPTVSVSDPTPTETAAPKTKAKSKPRIKK